MNLLTLIPLYVGPGIGLGTIILVLLIVALVVFSFGVILWIPIKRTWRKLFRRPGE